MLLPLILFAIAAVLAFSGAVLVAGENVANEPVARPPAPRRRRRRGARAPRIYIRAIKPGERFQVERVSA